MVEVVQDGQIRAYADFDNRSLPRSPQRTALANLPVLDISPFLRESTPDERIHMARALRSACIDIGFFYLIGHGFTRGKLDAVLTQGRRFFELPVADKLKLLSHNVDEPGYVRMGGVDPEKNRDRVVDIKERLSLYI
jgi:isopenicillin N synthase-like dioxygenase